MNQQEAFQLLSLASARDGRPVDAATALVWADDLERVAYHEAVDAVKLHFRESTEWLRPAHVIANVRRVREAVDRDARIGRQLEARREDESWALRGSNRVRVWRAMLDSPYESERTKAWIRKQLGVES